MDRNQDINSSDSNISTLGEGFRSRISYLAKDRKLAPVVLALVLAGCNTASPKDTPTPTQSPYTPIPIVTESPIPIPTPIPTESPTITLTPTQTPTEVPTQTTTMTPTRTPGNTPSTEPTITPTEIQQAAAPWLLPKGDPNRLEPAFHWNRGGPDIPLGLDTTTKPVNGKYEFYLYGVELIEKFDAQGQAGILTISENPKTGTRVIELFRVSAADDYVSVLHAESTTLAGSAFEGDFTNFNILSWEPQKDSLVYFINELRVEDYGDSLTQAVQGSIDNSRVRFDFATKLAKGIDTPETNLPAYTWTDANKIQIPQTPEEWNKVPMFYSISILQMQAPTPTPTT